MRILSVGTLIFLISCNKQEDIVFTKICLNEVSYYMIKEKNGISPVFTKDGKIQACSIKKIEKEKASNQN